VLQVNDLGELVPVHVSLDMAKTASQAVGPPLSSVEMSAAAARHEAGQETAVAPAARRAGGESGRLRLGPLAVSGGKGLATNYADMIRAAFNGRVVEFEPGRGRCAQRAARRDSAYRRLLTADQPVLAHGGELLVFWGLAIAAYEATQVSDDTPFDKFVEGNPGALTRQQQVGMRVFMGLDGATASTATMAPSSPARP